MEAENGDADARIAFEQDVWLSMEAVENPVQGRLRFFQKDRQWFIGWSAETASISTGANDLAQVPNCCEHARLKGSGVTHHELQDAVMAMKCNESGEQGDMISFQFWTRSATLPLFYLNSKQYDKFMECLRQRVTLKRYLDPIVAG